MSTGTSRADLVKLVEMQHTELWSRGDLTLIDECYADDFVGYFPGHIARGHEGIRTEVVGHRAAFTDWREEVLEVIVEGNTVVTRFRSSGTDHGGFLGHAPTGKKITITEVCVFRIQDGKIAEQWVYPDILALQRQLGLVGDATGSPD